MSGASRTTARPVRFGVAGCGGIGRWHARAIRALPGLELVALAEPADENRRRAEKDFDVPVLADAESLIRRPDVEVVAICTPPAFHAPLAELAANAGKHVLVEKPVARSVADLDRVIAACERQGVLFGAVHQQRGRSAARLLERLVRAGEFGRVLLASLTHTWFMTQAQLDTDPWRGDSAAGGGVLLDQAVHGADLLVWLLGEPAWVSGATAALALRSAAEDTAVATVGFPGGALATLAAGNATNRARDDIVLEIAGTRGGARLEVRDYDHAELVELHLPRTEGGRARALASNEIERLVRGEEGGWRAGPRHPLWRVAAAIAGPERGGHAFRSPRAFLRRRADRVAQAETGEPQGHAAVLAAMARAVRGQGAPLASGRDARASLALIEGVRASQAAGGSRILLDAAPDVR